MPIGWKVASEIDISSLESLAPGGEIDNFRVIDRLHTGGTAHLFSVEVTKGSDPGFPLVMKVPRVGHDQPTESILGYETEAMILPALQGAHVPRFVAAGDLARVPYLTMEWVQGTGLAAIAATAPLPEARVLTLGAAVADAVHALHLQNAIHHDLKPDNIIIREDETAVLLDFGFAHHAHFPDFLAEEKRFASGSAPYVSPEQLTGSREDPRSDIFALGVVLYELATGELPFGVPDTLNAMKNRLWASPVPPRARAFDSAVAARSYPALSRARPCRALSERGSYRPRVAYSGTGIAHCACQPYRTRRLHDAARPVVAFAW